MSQSRTTLFYYFEVSQTDALPAILLPPHPPLVFSPLVFESGPRYELFPESVTGVIESALSSLSAKY